MLITYAIRAIKRKTARKAHKCGLANGKGHRAEAKEDVTDRKIDTAHKKNQATPVSNIKHKDSKPFSSADVMMKQLDSIEEPIIKSEYSNLAINFDKQGRSIKE